MMADLLHLAGVRDRKVWLCDSFEGHRAPEEIDGRAALEYAQDTDDPHDTVSCIGELVAFELSQVLFPVVSDPCGRVHQFLAYDPKTDTWEELSAVNGWRPQSPHRSRRRIPAMRAIRSSSAGQT